MRVSISKPHGYLRRPVKLEVVAEYYLDDLVFRNRGLLALSGSRVHTESDSEMFPKMLQILTFFM